jgi:hypothetical protein
VYFIRLQLTSFSVKLCSISLDFWSVDVGACECVECVRLCGHEIYKPRQQNMSSAASSVHVQAKLADPVKKRQYEQMRTPMALKKQIVDSYIYSVNIVTSNKGGLVAIFSANQSRYNMSRSVKSIRVRGTILPAAQIRQGPSVRNIDESFDKIMAFNIGLVVATQTDIPQGLLDNFNAPPVQFTAPIVDYDAYIGAAQWFDTQVSRDLQRNINPGIEQIGVNGLVQTFTNVSLTQVQQAVNDQNGNVFNALDNLQPNLYTLYEPRHLLLAADTGVTSFINEFPARSEVKLDLTEKDIVLEPNGVIYLMVKSSSPTGYISAVLMIDVAVYVE